MYHIWQLNVSSRTHSSSMLAGAGAQCEGEDWEALSKLPSLDVDMVHVYDRQVSQSWCARRRAAEIHLQTVLPVPAACQLCWMSMSAVMLMALLLRVLHNTDGVCTADMGQVRPQVLLQLLPTGEECSLSSAACLMHTYIDRGTAHMHLSNCRQLPYAHHWLDVQGAC